MQLNVYVPREKESIIRALDQVARRTGRPKNDLVLEALEEHLKKVPVELGVYDLGQVVMPSRDELYGERWDPPEAQRGRVDGPQDR